MERMTLEDAIAHAKEVAEKNYRGADFESIDSVDNDIKANCIKCAKEHEQLAEWLKELKSYKDAEEQGSLVRLPDDLNRTLYQVNYRWTCTEYGEENNKCEIYDCKCECDIRKEYYIAEVDLQYIPIKSYYNCLGEFLFLTREEAEKKLEEMRNNGSKK
mgnify:CR=1 FL=1